MLKVVGASKAKAAIQRNILDQKMDQVAAAVEYCKVNNCRGKKALSTGLFPMIKDHKTITRRLDGEVISGHEKDHVSILLPEEEEVLVTYALNKSRAMQPLKRKDMNDLIMNILRIRVAANKKLRGGRKCVKLSKPAQDALQKGHVSKYFWLRFDAKFGKVLTKKRVGHTSLARAAACTTAMAIAHIDSLAEEFISKGIMTNYVQVKPGVWTGNIDGSRVFNRDETPQAIRYGVDGTAKNLAYCGKGESCNELIKENREFVTIEPFITLSGKVMMCHVIFAAAGFTTAMAPAKAVEEIPNLFISVTDNGYQTGESCLRSCQFLEKIIAKENTERPISMLTDGHSSRFDVNVLRFNRENKMTSHVSPPDTTSVTQTLDQINAALHSSYIRECDKFFRDNHINRELFLEILADVWKNWTTAESIVKAWRRCGISSEGLSYEWMQQDKLTAADALVESENVPSTPSTSNKEPWDVDSPVGFRRGTLEYEKAKCALYREALRERAEKPLSPDEVDGFLTIDKIKVPAKKKAKKLTNVHGSMSGSGIFELRVAAEKEQHQKEQKQQEKKSEKVEQSESFIRCKDSCVCESIPCKATGLKQCPVCSNVIRSQCSKKKCMVNGIKPLMVLCSFDVTKNLDRKEKGKAKNKAKKRKLEFEFSSGEDSEGSDEDGDLLFEHLIQEQHFQELESGTSRDDHNDVFYKLANANVSAGMWVVVYWEGEKFLGVVKSKSRKSYHVFCLEKPYGVCEPQLLEEKGDEYDAVYNAEITTPREVDVDGTVYWQYELLN